MHVKRKDLKVGMLLHYNTDYWAKVLSLETNGITYNWHTLIDSEYTLSHTGNGIWFYNELEDFNFLEVPKSKNPQL